MYRPLDHALFRKCRNTGRDAAISNYARYEARPKFPINSSRCVNDATTGKRQVDELEEFNEQPTRVLDHPIMNLKERN